MTCMCYASVYFILHNSYNNNNFVHSCTDVQFGVEDLHTYAHLLSVALNSKICQGKVADAVEIGMLSSQILGEEAMSWDVFY